MIEFRTLGTLELHRANGVALDSLLAQPKRIALLAYICLARPYGFHRRDTILGHFWPDSDETHARASLRRALHVLRQTLGESAFRSRGDEEIAINPDVVWCDAVAFEQQLGANSPIEALDLYRGELLPGFFLDETPDFNRWLEDERSRLRSSAARAAQLAAESQESGNELSEAVNSARRAVELTGTSERQVRRLMELLVRVGDRAGALHAYEDFAARVTAELGAEPSDETRAFADSIRGIRSAAAPRSAFPESLPIAVTGNGAEPLVNERSTRRWVGFRTAIGMLAVGLLISLLFRTVVSPFSRPVTERKKLTFSGIATQGALSPDGQFLAYTLEGRDSTRLVVQDLTGGPADTILTVAPWTGDNTLEWSPNSARLLVRLPGKAALIHRRGQQELVRAFQPGDQSHWLPDGLHVSLTNLHRGRFLIVDLQSGDSLTLPIRARQGASWAGAWSRDGRMFAVVTDTPDSVRWVIRGISLDGTMEELVSDSVELNSPQWSGKGNVLYYLRGSDAIWRVKVSTRTGKTIGAPEEVETGIDALPASVGIVHFSLSGDGRQLVYTKGESYSNIYRVVVKDSMTPPRLEPLTSGTSFKWSPVVSPDRKWIAFASQTKDGADLFRMPIAGGRAEQITQSAKVWPGSEIAWSPDGRSIAFVSVRGSRSQVWFAAVSSGELHRFDQTNVSIRTATLTWAPGSRIAYENPRTYIHVVDPTTGKDEILVRDTADAWFHFPRYAPNGKEIAMLRYHEPEKNLISILRLAGGTETRLPAGTYFPRAWSADGRFIYAQLPSPVMVRVDPSGKKPAETVFTAPVRGMDCTPDLTPPEHAFICAMFDFFSDIWTIENFDRD